MIRLLFLVIALNGFIFSSRASHVMGGEITWECQGGSYVFQLVFYRDCNGAEINTISETIRVWNHPTVNSILVNFVDRIDISPTCSPVSGSPAPLDCGTGNSGGNGVGAIEKVIYRSLPISLSGNPGASGWIFTYENFSRSNSLTNISNPSTYGITLAAKMYAIPGNTGGCLDKSPQFLQEPYFVSCAGTPYVYNMNAVDPDLDSLAIDFGVPYNNFPTGIYDPPNNPIPVPFELGFSYSSPTPGTSVNPLNIPAQIDASSGELTLTSYTTGNYAVKASVRSFRNGILISEVEREMQLVILPCSSANSNPVINAPFAGSSFETTVNAGSLVNFEISSTDIELLQDGSPQTNWLTASGPLFGTGFIASTGCAIQPCATLSSAPMISGTQGVNTDFNWQTSCDHLVDANGNALDLIPYHFVFRVQDDFCQVPKVSYATVTINVVNPGVIQAPQIDCIQSDISGNVTINWNPVPDPSGTFQEYQIHSVQSGLIASIPTIGTSSYTIPSVTSENDYFIAVSSGCNGNTLRYSDTVSNIFLLVNNPSNGTAVLQWNDPTDPALPSMNPFYHIYREYPVGTWTLIDSVPYGLNFYRDTIDICSVFLRYQIVLPNQPCDFISNAPGDDFEDMLTPDIPVISFVSVDTLTGNVILNWNENSQPDTYGYVIYTFDENGFIYELDTVWGIGSTSFIHATDPNNGPLTYSVAAFDSCYTPAIPATFQTSAKADIHSTIFLTSELDICNYEVTHSWTSYVGWNVQTYEIWGRIIGEPWTLMGSTTANQLTVNVEGLEDYCFFVKAISGVDTISFSNLSCLTVIAPMTPSYHYLQVATVEDNAVRLQHLVDASSGIQGVLFEKMDTDGIFQPLIELPAGTGQITHIDSDVDVISESYTYRVRVVDSCGRPGMPSNIGRTILLHLLKDDVRLLNYLNWNGYQDFNGSILGYTVYRGIDGVFGTTPIATVAADQLSYTDDLNEVTFTGKVCYYVEAIEGSNLYNAPQISRSNEICEVFEPLVYVPNAFTPEGLNPCFKPILSNFNPSEYNFIIYDRWAQEIFSTNSPDEGWYGFIRDTDKLAQTGMYVYLLKLSDGDGNEIVKRGHVTLLK